MPTPRESGANLFRQEYDLDASPGGERPVVRLCNLAIAEGLANGARAIRFQVIDDVTGGVDYEIDGAWRQVMKVPIAALGPLVNRVKVMAAMDISRQAAQDGELHVRSKGLLHRFTVRTENTGMAADTVMLRLLD